MLIEHDREFFATSAIGDHDHGKKKWKTYLPILVSLDEKHGYFEWQKCHKSHMTGMVTHITYKKYKKKWCLWDGKHDIVLPTWNLMLVE